MIAKTCDAFEELVMKKAELLKQRKLTLPEFEEQVQKAFADLHVTLAHLQNALQIHSNSYSSGDITRNVFLDTLPQVLHNIRAALGSRL